VEFVSANPTGPLHIGHGRGAAFGDSLARILEAVGHNVHREYYINDAGNQMNKLGESIYARYMQIYDKNFAFPEDGYKGEYITKIALILQKKYGDTLLKKDEAIAVTLCKDEGKNNKSKSYKKYNTQYNNTLKVIFFIFFFYFVKIVHITSFLQL